MFDRRPVWLGRLGVTSSLLGYLISFVVLDLAMYSNGVNGSAVGVRGGMAASRGTTQMHAQTVAWCFLFGVLQIVSPLLFAITLRARYGFRTAVCCCCSVSLSLLLNSVAMAGMLVWLRVTMGAR
jgi:hypothetical protein